jgi:hypothetical protein
MSEQVPHSHSWRTLVHGGGAFRVGGGGGATFPAASWVALFPGDKRKLVLVVLTTEVL